MDDPRQARLASLDALRIVGFLLVFLFHFEGIFSVAFPERSLPHKLFSGFGFWGATGTNMFFMLSAFLLYRSLRSGSPWIKAVSGRVGRIYPSFVLVLALYLFLAPLSSGGAKFPHHPAGTLLYILVNFLLLPGMTPITPIVTVAWSLSYVLFSYLAIPAIYHLFRMHRLQRPARVAIWFGLATAIAFGWSGHERMIYFVAGILTAEAAAAIRVAEPWSWLSMGAGAAMVTISRNGGMPLAVGVVGMIAVVWGLLSSAKLDAVLKGLSLRKLAEISYPFFLVHGLVLQFLRAIWPLALISMEDMVVVFIVSAGLSLISASVINAVLIRPFQSPAPSVRSLREAAFAARFNLSAQ